jgi:hypothetical protein
MIIIYEFLFSLNGYRIYVKFYLYENEIMVIQLSFSNERYRTELKFIIIITHRTRNIYIRSNFYKCSTNQIIFPFIFIICSLIYICMTECLWYVSILWLLTYTTILWSSFLSNCFSIHDNKLWICVSLIQFLIPSFCAVYEWPFTN